MSAPHYLSFSLGGQNVPTLLKGGQEKASVSTRQALKEYSFAVALSFIALGARFALDPYLGDHVPYVTFFLVVMITTWYGGVGASLMAVILSGLLANWFFVSPRYTLRLVELSHQVGYAAFWFVSLSIVAFGQAWRRAQQRAEQTLVALRDSDERLRISARHLEHLVAERTEELVHSQSHLRALATELNLAEQRTRKQLATELHDYLGQLLVLSKLKLGQAKRQAMIPFVAKSVEEVQEVLDQALTYTRTLVAQLSPPMLHEFGFLMALKWLADQMKARELVVTLDLAMQHLRLPEEQAMVLFQSVRELLLNIVKHAKTKQAHLAIEQIDRTLHITVTDEGSGFDVAASSVHSPLPGFGLFSIRERMLALGGRFDLTSQQGQGTQATLIVPMAPAPAKEELDPVK